MAFDAVFSRAAEGLPELLADYPIPTAAARAVWEAVPADLATLILARGAAAEPGDWPALRARDWLDYSRTGNRARFEERYFTRRRRLNALAMAAAVAGDGRHMDAITDGLWLICEESGWQLPAHNAYRRGGQRLPMPVFDAPIVDLFAAETAAQLAVLASLLGPELDAVAPELTARIDREIQRRVIRPYLDGHFWWMGDGAERMNNWTAWCTQNVLLTVFTRPFPPEVRRAVTLKAAASLDAFLKDYAEDGACEEGPQYYRHAGLCLWGSLEILSTAAPDAFAPLWALPKIRAMAGYIAEVHVEDRAYFNFADSAAILDRCGLREYLFGKAVGMDLLAGLAARDAVQEPAPDLPDEINLWYRILAATRMAELRADPVAQSPDRPTDHHYPGTGLMIARDARWALAVKAGCNGDGHNHNDVGSVTLWRDGRPVLIDIGVETYSAKTFSPERYDIWTMQSAWHNLPTFGGVMQQDGAGFAARDVEVGFTPEAAQMSMQLAGAWPAEARLRSFRRQVTLTRGAGVTLADSYDSDLPAELSLILAARPEVEGCTITLPGLARIQVSGGLGFALDEVAITDARLRQSWPETIWRLRIGAGSALTLQID